MGRDAKCREGLQPQEVSNESERIDNGISLPGLSDDAILSRVGENEFVMK